MNRKIRPGGRQGVLAGLAALTLLAALAGVPAVAIDDDTCLACHSDPDALSEAGDRAKDLVVTPDSLAGSVHEGFSCTDCHQDLAPDDAEIPHPPELQPVDCSQCHDDVAEGFHANSVHATAIRPRPGARSACSACHGNHHILAVGDAESPVSRQHVADLCARCHEPAADHGDPVSQWKDSIHGRAVLLWEVEEAPTCVACHPAHAIRQPEDPAAAINRRRVMDTCGNCHPSERKAVLRGVHGKAWQEGNLAAATCVDCHGSHGVDRPGERASTVYAARVSETCGRCHDDPDLAVRFHLRPDRVATYRQSYHGKGTAWGSPVVANCSSCHGYHDIRGMNDPASTIYPANLRDTCGKAACHPGASEQFVRLPVHADRFFIPPTARLVLRYLRMGYILIISLTITFMVVHQVLEIRAILRLRREIRAAERRGHRHLATLPPVERPAREPLSRFVTRDGKHYVIRWDVNQVVQHILLVVSFTTLVITGFPLEFPASWASHLGSLGPVLFDLRGILHRGAAILLILVSIYHVGWLLFTGRGRRELWELVPQPRRFRRKLVGNLRWFLGLEKEPPPGVRYTYREKLEYWALVWGNFVMITTGIILWTAPRWHYMVVAVARLVHSYEALLALLAILVWHMIGAHLKPGIFPMNPTWLTGGLDIEAFREEHAEEYAKMVAWYGFDPMTEEVGR